MDSEEILEQIAMYGLAIGAILGAVFGLLFGGACITEAKSYGTIKGIIAFTLSVIIGAVIGYVFVYASILCMIVLGGGAWFLHSAFGGS